MKKEYCLSLEKFPRFEEIKVRMNILWSVIPKGNGAVISNKLLNLLYQSILCHLILLLVWGFIFAFDHYCMYKWDLVAFLHNGIDIQEQNLLHCPILW